jgi:hypothetical protein
MLILLERHPHLEAFVKSPSCVLVEMRVLQRFIPALPRTGLANLLPCVYQISTQICYAEDEFPLDFPRHL